MKLLQHYENLLGLASLSSTADGVVRRKTRKDDKINNLFVQGKPVVMPIYEQLNSETISERLVFHPFAESSSKGESVIVSELRTRFAANLGLALMGFIMKCVEFGASKAEHRKLNPIQSEMLDCVRKIDEKDAAAIADFFVRLLKMPDKKNAALIQIYLSRHGQVGDKEYARAGIVGFPLYKLVLEELEKTKDRSIEGIKMSEKNLRYIKDLYEYVFPELKTNATGYNRGSNSDVAPYMDALMRTTAAVQGAINERIRLFESVFKDDMAPIPEDWMDAIDALPELLPEIRVIRVQPGGDGEPRVADVLAAQNQMAKAGPAVPMAVPAPVPYVQQQPQYQPPPPQYQPPQPVPYSATGFPPYQQPYQPQQQPYGGQQMQPPQYQQPVNLNPFAPNQTTVSIPGAGMGKPLWD